MGNRQCFYGGKGVVFPVVRDECFRSLDTLLTGCVVASGCEPQAHQRNDRVVPGD